MTDQDIKDKLFELWAEFKADKRGFGGYFLWIQTEKRALSNYFSEKTIREIKALMINDGIDLAEINKIIGV